MHRSNARLRCSIPLLKLWHCVSPCEVLEKSNAAAKLLSSISKSRNYFGLLIVKFSCRNWTTVRDYYCKQSLQSPVWHCGANETSAGNDICEIWPLIWIDMNIDWIGTWQAVVVDLVSLPLFVAGKLRWSVKLYYAKCKQRTLKSVVSCSIFLVANHYLLAC